MTALIVVNSIAAAVVIGGLITVGRLGHLTATGRFEREVRPLELHHGAGEDRHLQGRRAA